MLKSQIALLRMSEIRSRLAEIRELSDDARTDEIKTEREGLMVELRDTETVYQRAVKAEDADEGRRVGGDTGESAEHRALVERSTLSAFVAEANGRPLQGPEAELRAATFGEHSRSGLVPFETLLPRQRESEHRADASTDVSDSGAALNSGALGHPVLGRVFATGAAAYLGTRFDSVDRGVSAYPVLTAGETGTMRARGAPHDAVSATVKVSTLSPTRLVARYVFRVEDLARINLLEEALRSDLSMALSEAVDAQAIAGSGVAPNVPGFLTAITAPVIPGNTAADYGAFVREQAAAVDGRAATNISQVRLLCSPSVYRHFSGVFTSVGEISGVDYLIARSGVRASPHMPTVPLTGGNNERQGVGELLQSRSMAPGGAVAAVWSGFELTIRDDATLAANGEIALTAMMLWNFKLLRQDGHRRGVIRVAAV